MASRLQIMAVCGFGIGSSMLLKMKIDEVLKAENIDAETYPQDVTSATSQPVDIVFTSNEISHQLEGKVNAPLIIINNFMDTNEIKEKGMPVINKLLENNK